VDKLRALQYCIAAAEEKSFSGAARRLGVTVPAVAKLITALERKLGTPLFDRNPQGLALNANGESYLEACAPALAQLAEADELVNTSATRSRGTVVFGVHHVLGRHCITPALPRFHARYPDIRIDLRECSRMTEEQMRGVDVFLMLGWPQVGDLVHRRIGHVRFTVCAAPTYWAAHGVPHRPKDLERHNCLLIRTIHGTVMDHWPFQRGEEKESVTVNGWLVADNTHRDILVEAALAGEGIVRIIDLADYHTALRAGQLVPVLTDWESTEVPPVNLMYRPSCRRIPRVRILIDFVTALFRDLEEAREHRVVASERPPWSSGRYRRASAIAARGQAGRR
jgi:LysR family transcriptional regulator for bpeEF and oprC